MSISHFSDSHLWTVFYRPHQGVFVTDGWFCAHGRRYAVKDIAGIGWRYGSMDTARSVAAKVTAMATALVGLIVVWASPSLLVLLGGGLYALTAGAVLWLSFRRWPTPLELGAVHRGAPTVVYTSTDRLEFHKVRRALMRALERHDTTS